jgi:hypothetical protein
MATTTATTKTAVAATAKVTGTQQPTKSCNGGGGDNAAMVLRCLTMFLRRNPYRKKKGRKSQFLFTAQLLRKNNFSANYQRGKIWKIAHKNKKRITAVTQ